MSRPSSMAQRPLTLTEELEKLEQSITLTLQEIDHNFSQAHRIVTTNILPLVEQYAESSRDVWDGAKFWKQFFEASANVSLSGYEEKPDGDTTVQEPTNLTAEEDQTVTETAGEDDSHHQLHRADDIELTSLSLSSHSTPPVTGHDNRYAANDDDTSTHHYTDDYSHNQSHTPMSSSPFIPPAEDPIMHQMADKTYRVQATPLGKGYGYESRSKFTVTPKTTNNSKKYAYDDSPISSPEPEAPKLHAEIFSSPMKGVETPNTGRKRRPSANQLRITPKPGISVLTPARGGGGAKEASKRIVEDLLFTAGANDTTDDLPIEQSPSIIQRVERLEDETF
ncbi:Cytochrome P450 family protein [Aspergillus niger]|uniref:DASH complex subunit ASK1 n=1 Tax=Aspergillus niger TaxID=5061 RepID=A0A505I2G3_ASPNG|nr:Cytochrome P450 family protein [Aspergillus niger]